MEGSLRHFLGISIGFKEASQAFEVNYDCSEVVFSSLVTLTCDLGYLFTSLPLI